MYKKYSNIITQLIFLISAILLDLIGIVGHIVSIIINNDPVAIYASIIIFPLFSLFFWFGFYIEKTSTFVFEEDQIVIHFYVMSKPKIKYNQKQGLFIKYKDIVNLETEYHPGDLFFTDDTTLYHLELIDGSKISFTLFRYGKKNEKEIYNTLKDKIFEKNE